MSEVLPVDIQPSFPTPEGYEGEKLNGIPNDTLTDFFEGKLYSCVVPKHGNFREGEVVALGDQNTFAKIISIKPHNPLFNVIKIKKLGD